MIRLFRLCKNFGAKVALKEINLTLNRGEFVFLTGPSGAGKTTLLRLIFGSEKPSSGQIVIDGINLSRISRSMLDLLRRKVGFVFQDFKLLPGKTVFENVALALQVCGERPVLVRKKTHQVLRSLALAEKGSMFPLQLSGGEQQRVAIARAIVKDPLILLADEPTGNLDWALTQEIMGVLRKIHARGTTMIIGTHNRDLLEGMDHRRITLEKGVVREDQ